MRSLNKDRMILILPILFLVIFSNFKTYKTFEEFSFDKLKGKKILFEDITIKRNEIYDERISAIKEATYPENSKIYSIKLSEKYPIYHGCYDSIFSNKQYNEEYIQYYNTKISINVLLKNNINKKKISTNNYILFTGGIDFFKFKGSDFILLSARDRRFFRNLERNYWILLKVENKDVLSSFCFIDSYTEGKNCFGDFNNDGLLDYMNWDFLKDKICLYSLACKDFKIDKNHFIKVKESKEQEKMRKEQDIILAYDLLDKKNSKWFYKF